MKITNISISNFRSISNLNINIQQISDKSCTILIGKNESGKSNILKAISLLDPESNIEYEHDCNKSAKKKKEFISIDYDISLENSSVYQKKYTSFGIPKELQDHIAINKIQRKVTFNFMNERDDRIWIWIDNEKIFSKYAYCSSNNKIEKIEDLYIGIEEVTKENISELIGTSYEILNKSKIEKILEINLFSEINEAIPKIITWRPSSEYMINEPINLPNFSTNPTSSIPLKNIFKIAEIDNIEERIELISNNNTEERRELEEDLSNSITNYINKIWPEHKINIIIDIENMYCKVLIEDKDDRKPKYKMDQRSDGFKQFISILLSLSIESNTEQLKDRIILLDEPEVHLHPSGVRYLKDELLNISKNNIVFISTHSIYMVDKLNINRHFKVDKDKSITRIKQIDKNNPYEEELIYEALGTSVYEHVQPNMLVFEGKTDKDIFDAFTYKFRNDFKPVQLGTISADGVEKMPQYTKFIDGKFVKGFILTDSDKDGVRIKESIIEHNKSFSSKNTFEINDIIDTKMPSTLEDLYPQETIIQFIKEKHDIDIELNGEPVIKQLEKKNRNLKGKLNIKDLKGGIVNYIIDDINKLTKAKTQEKYSTYYNFTKNLNTILKD
ncbi:AAA family ATPase [Marinifilum fragile]|uniref:ATP-dependent nuclease n=1 Tax=Marinifilum fragile TaxID=570161 RepID=UPI002AA72802|nr:AAA family ATPase [Marinifilum fragile]